MASVSQSTYSWMSRHTCKKSMTKQCENPDMSVIEAEWRGLDKPGATKGGFLEGMKPSLTPEIKYTRDKRTEEHSKRSTVDTRTK